MLPYTPSNLKLVYHCPISRVKKKWTSIYFFRHLQLCNKSIIALFLGGMYDLQSYTQNTLQRLRMSFASFTDGGLCAIIICPLHLAFNWYSDKISFMYSLSLSVSVCLFVLCLSVSFLFVSLFLECLCSIHKKIFNPIELANNGQISK